MTKPLLTIGLPTYNRAATLARSLETILAHSLSCDPAQYEILVVDDGSTDGTRNELDRLASLYPLAPFRVLHNEPKLPFDETVYRVYKEARGDFLWSCSDRFFYNVDIGLVLGIISTHRDVRAITFSDLLRRVYPVAADRQEDLENIQDDAVLQKLGGSFHSFRAQRYSVTSVQQVVADQVLYGGAAPLFDATPDCIVRVNHSAEWLTTYREFIGSFNVALAGMLEPFRDSEAKVAFLQYPSFCEHARRSNSGGNRHNWLAVIEHESLFQRVFPFFPSAETRRRQAHRVLFDFYMYQKAERDMVHPITRVELDDYCRTRGYSPPAIFRLLIGLFELDLPQGYHRALRGLYQRATSAKNRIGFSLR